MNASTLYLHHVRELMIGDCVFLRTALQLHPDKNKHRKAEIAFKLISEVRFIDSHVFVKSRHINYANVILLWDGSFFFLFHHNARITFESLSHFDHYSNLCRFNTLFLYWYCNWCSEIKLYLWIINVFLLIHNFDIIILDWQ